MTRPPLTRPTPSRSRALFGQIAALLRLGWSPEQIAGRRARIEDGVEQQADTPISHEAIYAALYALPRGELRRELIACLRQGKPRRGRVPPVHASGAASGVASCAT